MKIVVTGSDGMLGHSVVDHFNKKNHEVIGLNKRKLNLQESNIKSILHQIKNIDFIIHCAAFTNVNDSEIKKDLLEKINIESIKEICSYCNKTDTKLLYPQTFMVLKSKSTFHSDKSKEFNPIGSYAKSKLEAEKVIENYMRNDQYKIIRLGGFFGGGKKRDKNFIGNFINKIYADAKYKKKKFIEVGDRVWQPTYTKDIAKSIEFAIDSKGTRFQYASSRQVSFYTIAKNILKIFNENNIYIKKINNSKIKEIAKRPEKVIIKSSKLFVDKGINHSYLPRLKEYIFENWI